MTGSPRFDPAVGAPETLREGSSGASGFETDRLARWLLGLALVIGLLRFFRLGEWSLWFDEALTWGDAHDQERGNYNVPGYLLIRLTVDLLGGHPSESILRLAPALAGWLAIPLTAWCLLPLTGARRAALAAALVAASPWQLYWSQNARFYTFAEVLTLVGGGIAVRGALGRDGLYLALGILTAAAATAFQLQAVVFVGLLLFAAILLARARTEDAPEARQVMTRWLTMLVVAALLLAAWSWTVFDEYRDAKRGLAPTGVLPFVLATGYALTPALCVAAACAMPMAFIAGGAGRIVLLMATGGVAVIGALGLVTTSSAQYVFVFFPWFAALAAWPIASRALADDRIGAGYAALVVLPLLAGSVLQLGPYEGERPRWREALALVEEERLEGDLVFCLPAAVGEFYASLGGTSMRASEHVALLDAGHPESFAQPAREGRPMWFVVRRDYLWSWTEARREKFRRFLTDECRFVRSFDVHVPGRDLAIEVWRR